MPTPPKTTHAPTTPTVPTDPAAIPFDTVAVARDFGTPTWVYDADTLLTRIAELTRPGVTIRYAQKANSNLALLTLMRRQGVLVDAVTAGEVRRALAVGYDPKQIVLTADIFDDDAIEVLREHGCPVNVGSPDMISQLADAGLAHIPVTLRLNPGFGHGHSQKVNTGGPRSKHGIWYHHIAGALALGKQHGVNICGLHMHIGSGADFEHLAQVCDAMVDAVQRYVDHGGPGLHMISAGGGLPVPYHKEPEHQHRIDLDRFFDLWENARRRIEKIAGRSVELEVEPGRYLVAECGYLVTKIRSVKVQGEGPEATDFLMIDAGFNDLARPAMYGAFHHISVVPADGRAVATERDYVVAGPLCESCDVFTQEEGGFVTTRKLPEAKPGDLLVLHDAGAYGMAMSSNYNSRRIAAEVLFKDGQLLTIRERQTFESLTQFERIPEGL